MLRRLFALLLLLPAPALAQVIRGSVVDAATAEQLAGVNIRVTDRAGQLLVFTASDPKGRFELALPGADGVRLEFARMGYAATATELLVLNAGDVVDLKVRLTTGAVPLQPITVVAKPRTNQKVAEFYQRAAQNRRTSTGRIWTRADLDRTPQKTISRLLGTVPGRGNCKRREVFIDGMPLSITPVTGLAQAFRPPRTTRDLELAHMSVDLEPEAAPPPGTDLVDWLVPPEDVEGIEVYRDNEIPTQFNPDGELCQVTLIWRRSAALAGPVDYGTARTVLVVVGGGALIGFLLSLIH